MTPTKAKYLGVFYTFCLTNLLFLLGIPLVSWLIEVPIFELEGFYFLIKAFNITIPIVLVASLIFARKIGIDIIISGGNNTRPVAVIIHTIAFSAAFIAVYLIGFTENEFSDDVAIGKALIVLFFTWVIAYPIFFLPSLTLGLVLEWLLERHTT